MRFFQKLTYAMIWLSIFTMPWQASLILPGVGSINKVVGVLLIPIAVLTVLLQGKIKKPLIVFYFMAFFLAWNFLTAFWSTDSGLAIDKSFLIFQLFIFTWSTYEFVNSREQIQKLLSAYIFGNVIVAAMTIYQFYTLNVFFSSSRFYMENYNPNSTGVILALGIPMALYMAMNKSKLYLLYAPIVVLSIFIMASRSVSIVLLVILLLTVIYLFKYKIRFRKLFIVFLLVSTLIGFNQMPEGQQMRILSIGEELSGGTLSDRTLVWDNGIKAFSNNFVVGVGAGNFINGTQFLYSSYELNAHNAYLSVGVENGAIGLVLFVSILLLVFRYSRKIKMNHQEKWLCLLLLLPWITMSMTSHNEVQKYSWIIFSFVVCFYSISRKNSSQQVAQGENLEKAT